MQWHGQHTKECVKACQVWEHDLVMDWWGVVSMCGKRVQHTNTGRVGFRVLVGFGMMKFCRPRVAMRQMGYTTCASKWPSYLSHDLGQSQAEASCR